MVDKSTDTQVPDQDSIPPWVETSRKAPLRRIYAARLISKLGWSNCEKDSAVAVPLRRSRREGLPNDLLILLPIRRQRILSRAVIGSKDFRIFVRDPSKLGTVIALRLVFISIGTSHKALWTHPPYDECLDFSLTKYER